ncbi:MAG: MarR family transcriptional regulator [Deltaproteobacteria bacterium]|nr:MarR family transcriptional regulator [Deltaproteobacteria bacterium]MBW2419803.1 MarR family transcriptional regulator [Deltaproteobacteria bacterium]
MPPPRESLHRAVSALQRLAELFVERREQLASEAGLGVPQWRLLEEIATEHFMPSMFARRRSVSSAAISKLIRGLLDRGLISVKVSPEDGRQRNYALTARGRRTLDALRSSREHAIAAVWSDLPPRELERFADFGEELADRLESYAADPG